MRPLLPALLLLVACATSRGVPSTFANPLDLDYRFMPDTLSWRQAADPLVVLHGDEYYLFASRSGGYWHSPDMREWTLVVPDGLPIEDYAPAVVAIDGRLYYTAHKSKAVFTTDDARGRRPFGPYTFTSGGSVKVLGPKGGPGEGRVWLRIPEGRSTMLTTARNPAAEPLELEISVNGTVQRTRLGAGETSRIVTPVRGGSAPLALTFRGDRRLVLLETDFR